MVYLGFMNLDARILAWIFRHWSWFGYAGLAFAFFLIGGVAYARRWSVTRTLPFRTDKIDVAVGLGILAALVWPLSLPAIGIAELFTWVARRPAPRTPAPGPVADSKTYRQAVSS